MSVEKGTFCQAGTSWNDSELIVTWNGTIYTANTPLLVYQDEISSQRTLSENDPGMLFCIANSEGVRWHFPDGTPVEELRYDVIVQHRTETVNRSLSQLRRAIHRETQSGLWTCRQGNHRITIGIYHRGGGMACAFLCWWPAKTCRLACICMRQIGTYLGLEQSPACIGLV